MSNIIHKMSDKITGHGHDDEERESQDRNTGYEQQQQQRDDDRMPLPSQHMGSTESGTSGHAMQGKRGGFRQQQHDLGGDTSQFSSNRSDPMHQQQMPGPMMGGGQDVGENWDEGEDEADDEGRGTRRKDDYTRRRDEYADEFQKRYW
ncbi:LAME_0B04940g1_1 [Lachancea meyersii CBS 8951]|uniref:LAME_0B04940g1_1 n=1 Tax=Lachancea meyersii CBS 8951 TaxID=1266667 RepID=A0A1G4IVS0_9SACH|nr:LAME_0B04940g1_1 [Lachancea meyersii CBS 8951]